jgi:hypothetical protein
MCSVVTVRYFLVMNFDGGIETNHIRFSDKDCSKRVTRIQMGSLLLGKSRCRRILFIRCSLLRRGRLVRRTSRQWSRFDGSTSHSPGVLYFSSAEMLDTIWRPRQCTFLSGSPSWSDPLAVHLLATILVCTWRAIFPCPPILQNYSCVGNQFQMVPVVFVVLLFRLRSTCFPALTWLLCGCI